MEEALDLSYDRLLMMMMMMTNAITVYPLKNRLLVMNIVTPALLPLFIAVEEVFTRDVVQSPRRSYLDVFSCPKMMSFEVRFVLGE